MENLVTAYWNTKCSYTEHGQRITGAYTKDGHIIFKDHDRMISGVLTKRNNETKRDEPRIFLIEEGETESLIKFQIEIAYRQAHNYQYDTTGQADKLRIDPHDSTHGFNLPKFPR